MYKRKSNNRKHPHYSIEEKNQIVLLYLDHHINWNQVIIHYDITCSLFHKWLIQYKTFGTCTDNRGKATKLDNPNKGRPRKITERKLEDYSKEELIERCRMLEDIKKSMVYLESQKQKTNIK